MTPHREPGPSGAHPLATSLLARCTFPLPGSPLRCGVSGGPDSLALLVLACVAGCDVTAVHVDHGLRPGSSLESERVADAARRYGARFRAVALEVTHGSNLEARARAARFAALGPDVATGHTMDDQAETVLANALRGCGLDGLAAMRPGPAHPILGLRRIETEAVCAEAGLEPLRDPSNADPVHVRNRVRHELLPLCAEISGRDPVPLLARLASLAAADAEYLDAQAHQALPDPADAAALRSADEVIARRATREWLRAAGATAPSGGRDRTAPKDRHPPSLADVRKVLSVAQGQATATELAGGWRVRRTGGRLVVDAPPSVQSR